MEARVGKIYDEFNQRRKQQEAIQADQDDWEDLDQQLIDLHKKK